jgi:FkbM family methyltransferase
MQKSAAKRIRNAVVKTPGAQTLIKTAIRAGLLPIAISRRLQPLGSHWLTSPDGTRFRYVSDSTDQLARSFIWRGLGDWEETTIPVFYELARSARLFLDIGAYSGIYTLLACAANEQLHVVAFEPNPRSQLLLERNIDANLLGDRVTVERAAAGEHGGRAILRIPADETAASIFCDSGSPITVSVVSIDDVVPAEFAVDLVKIDVEGAELDVLKGMRRILTHDHPSLIIECLSSLVFARVRSLLEQHDYRRFGYFGPHGLESADNAVEPLPCYANFLCRP